MVIFDQLRISDDGKLLLINAHVNSASYFENVYIDSITIITADKVLETVPEVPSDNYIYKEVASEDLKIKEVNLVIDKGILDEAFNNTDSSGNPKHEGATAKVAYDKKDFSKGLFFVYIKVKGKPDECTPCVLDKEYSLGITFDENVLYQKVMQFTKSLVDGCNIPTGFTDFILLWNAFKASIETEHYVPAIKYYNMMFGMDYTGNAYGPYGASSSRLSTSKPCGCHG